MTNKPATDLDKGGSAEEALRLYFQQMGAFVVRGVKVRAGRDNVTDIDLWVYTRASVHARNIAIVDIKNKKRAKGYERLIWLKGLQAAVGADEAIVATTATKDDLATFAKRLGLKLLSPQVFTAVIARYAGHAERLSSEELEAMWRGVRLEGNETLAARMETNLVEIGLGLSFSALNIWIDEAAKLLVYGFDHERAPAGVARAVLLCASLVAIGADFVGRSTAFDDSERRHNYFREGLIFGNAADGAASRYLGFAERVATDYVDKSGAAAATIRTGFARDVETLPVGAFIDFFSRPAAGRDLMDAAIQLEAAAFSKAVPNFGALPPEAKTIIGLLIDYAGLDRRRILRASESTGTRASEMAEGAKGDQTQFPKGGAPDDTIAVAKNDAGEQSAGKEEDGSGLLL